MTGLDELREAIHKSSLRRVQPKPSVMAGSLDAFTEALERDYGPLVRLNRSGVMGVTFMGLGVFEDPRVPANRAVLKVGNEVVAVINLERESGRKVPELGAKSTDTDPTTTDNAPGDSR